MMGRTHAFSSAVFLQSRYDWEDVTVFAWKGVWLRFRSCMLAQSHIFWLLARDMGGRPRSFG